MQGYRSGGSRDFGGGRDRVEYDAVCAKCEKDCKVPFKPSGTRPVYCQDCYKSMRNSRD